MGDLASLKVDLKIDRTFRKILQVSCVSHLANNIYVNNLTYVNSILSVKESQKLLLIELTAASAG